MGINSINIEIKHLMFEREKFQNETYLTLVSMTKAMAIIT